MCILTLTYTKYQALERILAITLSTINSKSNAHGWGICNSAGLVWKTERAAHLCSNAGMCVRAAVGKAPNMIHVRAASSGVAVTRETAHPFEFNNIIGMHNGTLWSREEVVTYAAVSRESDSLRFFGELDAELNKEPDFVKAINNVMANWRGKFAFMVLDKRNGTRYVIRGKTANLFFTELKNDHDEFVGWVVNTDLDNLTTALGFSNQVFQAEAGIEILFSTPILLAEETIWKATPGGLVKVGELKENPLHPITNTITPLANTNRVSVMGTRTQSPFKGVDKELQTLHEFMGDESLVISDLETIFSSVFGHGLMSATADEITLFVNSVLQRITSSKTVREYLRTNFIYRLDLEFWKDNPQLHYPLGMAQNSSPMVMRALTAYREKNR
jgi:predicted glutamine amidotransferase